MMYHQSTINLCSQKLGLFGHLLLNENLVHTVLKIFFISSVSNIFHHICRTYQASYSSQKLLSLKKVKVFSFFRSPSLVEPCFKQVSGNLHSSVQFEGILQRFIEIIPYYFDICLHFHKRVYFLENHKQLEHKLFKNMSN